MTLYPTKTRLRLLTQVQRGEVISDHYGIDRDVLGHVVTSRMAELQRAGWVAYGYGTLSGPGYVLTAEGRRVLGRAVLSR